MTQNEKKAPENAGIIRNEKGQFAKGFSGNPLGKPEGTISLVTDIKNSLINLKKEQPEEYLKIIESYWKDRTKRELLIRIVEPHAFAPQIAIQNNTQINFPTPTKEIIFRDMPGLLEKVGISKEEMIEYLQSL